MPGFISSEGLSRASIHLEFVQLFLKRIDLIDQMMRQLAHLVVQLIRRRI